MYSDAIALFLDIWSFGITNIHIVFYKFSMLFFKVFGSLWVGTKYSIPYKGGKCIWCKTTSTIMFYYPENHRNDRTIKCIIKKISKKHKGGPFAVFWNWNSGKKRRGDPSSIFQTCSRPRKCKGSPFMFFSNFFSVFSSYFSCFQGFLGWGKRWS